MSIKITLVHARIDQLHYLIAICCLADDGYAIDSRPMRSRCQSRLSQRQPPRALAQRMSILRGGIVVRSPVVVWQLLPTDQPDVIHAQPICSISGVVQGLGVVGKVSLDVVCRRVHI